MPNLSSSPENIISEDIVQSSIELPESTDDKESENQKTDIFADFPEITQIAENIKSKFPKDFDLKTFQEITDQILFNLKKDYSLDYISTFIKESFENIFVDIISKDIEYFKQKSDDFFIAKIKNFIITEEKRKAEEEKRKAEEENIIKTDIKLDTENKVVDTENKVVDTENKVVDTENKVVDTENKVVDNKILNIEELNNITVLRKSYLNNPDIKEEDKNFFRVESNSIGFKIFKESFYVAGENSENETNIKRMNTFKKIQTLGLSAEQQEAYIQNLYVYEKILNIKVEDRTEEQKKFVEEFDKINKDLNIDLSIFKPISQNVVEGVSFDSQPKMMSTKSFNQIAENVVTNPQIDNFINSPTQQPIPTSSPKEVIKNPVFASEFENYIAYLGDDGFVDGSKIDNDTRLNDAQKQALLKNIENINQKIQKILDKDKLNNQLIKERIIVNCFKYLSKYLGNNGFADKIKVDINKDIKLTENPMTISVVGDIKGDHIGLHYNLETGKLSMDDFMAYDDTEKKFFMGKNNKRKEILRGVKLPTYAELETSAKEVEFKDKMKSIESLEDYKKNTKSTLDDKISSNFGNEEVNKFYIERFNEKNIAEQTVLKNIFDNWATNSGGGNIVDFENSTEIGQDKPNQHQMMKLIYNTLEYFRSPEDLRRFQTSINKLNVLIDKNRQDTVGTIKDPVFRGLFNENAMSASKEERKNDGLSEKKTDFNYEINYLIFFDMMSQSKKNTKSESIIDINIFEKIIGVLENNQEEIKDNNKFLGGNENQLFMDRYNKEYDKYADDDLDKKLEEFDFPKSIEQMKGL